MNSYRQIWTLAVACAVCFSRTTMAQGPVTPTERPLPPKTYMSEADFSLPIVISSRVRGTLTEVQLYSKTSASAPWQLTQKVSPINDRFVFRAPKAGEYWFTVVTVDRQGNRHPSNLAAEPPGLIVVFDKQGPTLSVERLPNRPEGKCFLCRAVDTVSGPAKTRVYFQTRDGVFRTLEPMAGRQNLFCVPKEAASTGMVRVIATDLAGNTVSQEASLDELSPPITVAKNEPTKGDVMVGDLPLPTLPQPPSLRKVPTLPPNFPNGPKIPPMKKQQDVEQLNHETPVPAVKRQQPPTANPENVGKFPPIQLPPAPILPAHVETPPAPTQHLAKKNNFENVVNPNLPANVKSFRRHLVNKPQVALKYAIEDQGPSGVGKVEVYLTYDKGQSWQRYGVDADRTSPVDLNLTTEGLVGIRLVVSNGRGFGGNPPRPGETPDWWVELDVTQPRAELHETRPGTEGDAGAFYISWTTSDKNTRTNGVELQYAEKREGPWHSIAKGLPATGTYRWIVPSNAGAHSFIRLTTTDEADNTTVTESAQPVVLDDLSRPRARVVGITTPLAQPK